MFSPLLILWVIFAHWVADFICQTNWMASNKSKQWDALLEHVCVYSSVMVLLTCLILADPIGVLVFAMITFVAHFITDAITSRITSKLFMGQFQILELYPLNRVAMKPAFSLHWFFVVIGFDQFLHYAQLFLTLAWVMK